LSSKGALEVDSIIHFIYNIIHRTILYENWNNFYTKKISWFFYNDSHIVVSVILIKYYIVHPWFENKLIFQWKVNFEFTCSVSSIRSALDFLRYLCDLHLSNGFENFSFTCISVQWFWKYQDNNVRYFFLNTMPLRWITLKKKNELNPQWKRKSHSFLKL